MTAVAMQWARIAAAAGLLLGLAGCGALGLYAGAPLSEDVTRQALTPGVSTKADVGKALGRARVNRFDSGYEVWVYDYKAGLPVFAGFVPVLGTVAGLADAATRDRELAILFDPAGVVRKYRLREAPSRVERMVGAR